MKKSLLLALLLLLPVMAGCKQAVATPEANTATPVASPSPVPPSSPTDAPTAAPTVAEIPRPAYEPLFEVTLCPFELPAGQREGISVDCGYLVVPEDRSRADGRTIRLAVSIFHPPGGVQEPDPIIYLMGGPGASALEFIHRSFDIGYAPVFAAHRDLILFDQRGVGLSQPALDCPEAHELGLELLDNELDGTRLTNEEADELIGQAFDRCHQELSRVADLSTYNTVASAADVNDLRVALDYEKVNLWGGSYGTRLALNVMRDHPEGLRSVVLDSTYPPDRDLYLESPINFDRSLTLLFQTCESDATCNAAFPNLRQRFFDTVQRLNETPLQTEYTNPGTRESYPAILTGDTFTGLIFRLLYETTILPDLPQLIYDASQGDLQVLIRIQGALLAQSTVSSAGMMLSVQCNEEVPFGSLEQFRDVMSDYPELTSYFRNSIIGEIGYSACEGWESGRAAATENEPVTSDIPTLIMQGEFDPVTPPHWGQQAAETLSNAYFALYPGVGHGASTVDGCPRNMMLAFLDDPTSRPDDSCIANMEQIAFNVPAVSQAPVELVPFSNQTLNISGMAPAGWEEVVPGTYVRGSSALDETALIMGRDHLQAEDLLSRLAEQLNFDPQAQPISQDQLGHFDWDLYQFELQEYALDLALTNSRGSAYFVLLVSEP